MHIRSRHALYGGLLALFSAALALYWWYASFTEWTTGQRGLPWSAYAFCGGSRPTALPETVRVGLYEEFPVPWRLVKLRQVDFPVTLTVAAASRIEFLNLRGEIQQSYPQVREVYFWPVLTKAEGYYTGAWSSPGGIRRVATEAEGLPVLWDLERPLGLSGLSLENWWENRSFMDQWLRHRTALTHIWRANVSMGLDPLFLRLVGMHFDPADYPTVSLHLDLYTTGAGLPRDEMARILRCGVERYGDRFIPAFGVLNDGEGPENIFVLPQTLRRDLQLAREAGVSQVWLFGVNGLNGEYLSVLHETLPLGSLPK